MFKSHSNSESVTAAKLSVKIRTRFKTCTLLPLKQHCKGDPVIRKKKETIYGFKWTISKLPYFFSMNYLE